MYTYNCSYHDFIHVNKYSYSIQINIILYLKLFSGLTLFCKKLCMYLYINILLFIINSFITSIYIYIICVTIIIIWDA